LFRRGSDGFVASRQSDDSEEGEHESDVRFDVPPFEDDAKVVGVPGKKHLVEWD